jgi:hypothetical protein
LPRGPSTGLTAQRTIRVPPPNRAGGEGRVLMFQQPRRPASQVAQTLDGCLMPPPGLRPDCPVRPAEPLSADAHNGGPGTENSLTLSDPSLARLLFMVSTHRAREAPVVTLPTRTTKPATRSGVHTHAPRQPSGPETGAAIRTGRLSVGRRTLLDGFVWSGRVRRCFRYRVHSTSATPPLGRIR